MVGRSLALLAGLFATGTFLSLAPATTAWAGMDYRCLAVCQQAGYGHRACLAHCDVKSPSQSTNPLSSARHGTDFRCADKCTGTGRPRAYCLRNCSY